MKLLEKEKHDLNEQMDSENKGKGTGSSFYDKRIKQLKKEIKDLQVNQSDIKEQINKNELSIEQFTKQLNDLTVNLENETGLFRESSSEITNLTLAHEKQAKLLSDAQDKFSSLDSSKMLQSGDIKEKEQRLLKLKKDLNDS